MKWWRQMWDVIYSISSIMMAFLLGVILGNILTGLPITESRDINVPFLEIIKPFNILTGLTTLVLFMMHGGIYLLMKTEGKLFKKVGLLTKWSIAIFVVLFLITTIISLYQYPHLSNRFKDIPLLLIIPICGFLSIANIPRLLSKKKYFQSFVFSALTMAFFLITVAIELYPSILISSIDSMYDVTIYEAASSTKTLKIMMQFVAIGGPLVLFYTYFVYKTFKGKVKLEETSY